MSLQIKGSRASSQGSGFVRPGVGDPGVFGWIGDKIKKATSFIPGPVGDISRALWGKTPATVSNATTMFQQTQQAGPPGPRGTGPIDRIRMAGQTLIPGGVEPFAPTGGCPTGFHPNKTDYFLKNGTYVAKGTRCVKNRRRNPLNPRAADRAISRIESAKKATGRLSRVTIRKRCAK